MLHNLDLSFITWMSCYQTLTLPTQNTKPFALCFLFDIQIKANFGTNVPTATEAYMYAVIISDRYINFQSDGNKMSVVY